jgi:hypothetical protein
VPPGDRVTGCDDAEVSFPSGEKVTVHLCRLEPRDEPGEAEGGFTHAELRVGDKSIGCVKLEDVSNLGMLCAGPDEDTCLSRLAADNLAVSDRFWAPRRFARSQLLVFLGDALESDVPSIEIVRVQGGVARSVFYSEHDRTPGEFVFSRLLDLDGDGVPELLGWQRAADLDDCQPYIPMAVFKLGEAGYARDVGLMEKWAREHGKRWRGPDPDDSITDCEDEAEGPAASADE